MAIITEQNCPTLRYLKWRDRLDLHPEFVKYRNKRMRGTLKSPKGTIVDIDYPYLKTFPRNSYALQSIGKEVVSKWNYLSEDFCSDIWTTSITYGKAFETATDSICKHRVELYKEMSGKTYTGTFIQATEDLPISLLYSIRLIDAENEYQEGKGEGIHVLWDGVILMISGANLLAAAYCNAETHEIETGAWPKVKKLYEDLNGSVDAALVFTVLDNLIFRKYADITVRDARTRTKKEKDTQKTDDDIVTVKSTINEDIDRYDVNWYTETVRSAGFARKGYMGFRWKGPRDNQHRELVPIKATWVRGYTRKAKKPYTGVTLKDFDKKKSTDIL